jgi:hypothetical protein
VTSGATHATPTALLPARHARYTVVIATRAGELGRPSLPDFGQTLSSKTSGIPYSSVLECAKKADSALRTRAESAPGTRKRNSAVAAGALLRCITRSASAASAASTAKGSPPLRRGGNSVASTP